jgi:hypothetical protein
MGRFQPFSEMCCTNGTQLASRNSRNQLIMLVLSNCHVMFPKKLNVAAHPARNATSVDYANQMRGDRVRSALPGANWPPDGDFYVEKRPQPSRAENVAHQPR